MVKIVRSYPAPESLKSEKEKANGRYNCRDVIDQLVQDFHAKCYICEEKNLQDIQVEHLLPHMGGKYSERKFDWDNLFLACPHCNMVKNQHKYDAGILNCCEADPEQYLEFDLNEGHVVVENLTAGDETAERTAMLVEEVFETRNTGILTYQSELRLKDLQREMDSFYKTLNEYQKKPKSRIVRKTLYGFLDRASAFAGFKRSYIREHRDNYPELYDFVCGE